MATPTLAKHGAHSLKQEFLDSLKQNAERRAQVEALIAHNEVAVNMTPDEVTASLGKPTRKSSRMDSTGQQEVWDFIKYARDHGIPLTGPRIAEITSWAPVIEVVAYQYFTNAGILLDNIRRPILADGVSSADRDSRLIGYWSVLHTMGHLLTVASSTGARPWLTQMAMSFEWRTWSPTFTLSRERTLWLMAAAVKSAVTFGEAVVEKYLKKLSASDHPVKSFDALAGLVAIGLDQPNSSGHILTELLAAGTPIMQPP